MEQQNQRQGLLTLVKRVLTESLEKFVEKLPQILQIFSLLVLLVFFSIAINSYFFLDVILVISDKNFGQNLVPISFVKVAACVLFRLVVWLAEFLLLFAIVKVVINNLTVAQSLKYLFKKTWLILSNQLFVSAIVFGFASVLAILTIFVFLLSIGLAVKIIYCLAVAILLFFVIRFLLRFSFYNIVAIIEEKYYTASLARSFAYLEGNVGVLFLSILFSFVLLICFEMILELGSIFTLIADSIPAFKDGVITRSALDHLDGFIPVQFCLIVNCLLYSSFKKELPEDFNFSGKAKFFLKLPLYLGVILLLAILPFLIF